MTEREFRDELRRKYRAEGFEELDTRAIAGALSADYEPDLAFRQGDSVYVIEVKTPGQATSADQIRRLREIVERRPNWSFRFMVVPRRPAAPEDIDAVDLVPSALRLADDVRQIAPPIALVALWIALETSLRRLLTLRQERPPFGTSSMTMARRLRDLEELTDEDTAPGS